MESFVRHFIRAGLVWLAVALLLGVSMALWPGDHLVYRPAHLHAGLLGFVSMMIFGVAYHVMPRFNARPLHSRRLAVFHLWIGNGSLALMVGGWLTRPTWYEAGNLTLQVGGVLQAMALSAFIYNIWRTLEEPADRKEARARMEAAARAGGRTAEGARLPMVGRQETGVERRPVPGSCGVPLPVADGRAR